MLWEEVKRGLLERYGSLKHDAVRAYAGATPRWGLLEGAICWMLWDLWKLVESLS